MKKWKNFEIDFLINNYHIRGIEYCMNYLNRNKSSITAKAYKLNIFVKKEIKSKNISNKRRVNNYKKYHLDDFLFKKNKYHAYILGYFWADGHIRKNSSVLSSINLIEDDALFFYQILENEMPNIWKKGKSLEKYWINNNEKKRGKNQITIRSYSQELYYYLYNNDYKKKSKTNFNKIWSEIPNKYKSYFI